MLKELLWIRPLLKELRGIRQALEMQNRLQAIRVEHETGRTAMLLVEPRAAGAKDESSVSAPDYAYIAKYQSAVEILGEQLGYEPSEEQVQEFLQGGPTRGEAP